MLPLLGLYADIYAERNGKHADAYAFIEPIKSRLFPATFDYVHRDLDGVETTTTQVLFGDLVAAVEENIDQGSVRSAPTRTDFKPGTSAQRHRLRDSLSSRSTDVTDMMRRLTSSFRLSSRRVTASTPDKSVASPAAPDEQPATADRRLSWRASAPDYGTF